jgi:hypothetical protein
MEIENLTEARHVFSPKKTLNLNKTNPISSKYPVPYATLAQY